MDLKKLRAHEPVHTGTKSFICKTCGKAYTHSSSLATHNKIHKAEKNKQNATENANVNT